MTSLRELLAEAGFHGHGLDVAVAVAQAESGGHTMSHNTNAGTGDNSYGLFQINMLGSLGPARMRQYHLKSYDDLFDPRVNARVAYEMSQHGTNFQPWTTYTRGTYQQYLGHDISINGAGVDPNGGTSDDAAATDHGTGDSFDIGSGQSLTDLKVQQEQEKQLAQQIAYVTGHGPKPTLHAIAVADTGAHTVNQDAVHTFLHTAQGELGESYVFGAKADASVAHPHALDCSGLTKWAAERAGGHLPDGAAHQYLALKKAGMLIPVKDAMHTPGALLFHFATEPTPGQGEPEIAHVAISKGNGMTIEAADEQDGIVSWKAAGRFNYAAVIPGIGTTEPGHSTLDVSHEPLAAVPTDHHGHHGVDEFAGIHTWAGGVWHALGSDLGTGTGAADLTGTDDGGTFDDHGGAGGLDVGHH